MSESSPVFLLFLSYCCEAQEVLRVYHLSKQTFKFKYNLSNYAASVSVNLPWPNSKPCVCCEYINLKDFYSTQKLLGLWAGAVLSLYMSTIFPTNTLKCSLEQQEESPNELQEFKKRLYLHAYYLCVCRHYVCLFFCTMQTPTSFVM